MRGLPNRDRRQDRFRPFLLLEDVPQVFSQKKNKPESHPVLVHSYLLAFSFRVAMHAHVRLKAKPRVERARVARAEDAYRRLDFWVIQYRPHEFSSVPHAAAVFGNEEIGQRGKNCSVSHNPRKPDLGLVVEHAKANAVFARLNELFSSQSFSPVGAGDLIPAPIPIHDGLVVGNSHGYLAADERAVEVRCRTRRQS